MAKQKFQQISELSKYLKKDEILPVYFLCGDDIYAINSSLESIINAVLPLTTSEFDKEIISADKGINLGQVLDMALAYPFGDGKKLIVLKNFEKIADKKLLTDYLEKPPEFTVLVLVQYDKIQEPAKEPFTTLLKNNFIFEAKKLNEDDLVSWVVEQAGKSKLKINDENARTLVDIVGTEKSLLDMQLKKIYDFLGEDKEVTLDIVRNLASYTKEFSIFDLQDALGSGNKARALEIGYNLLDHDNDIVYILTMLTRFISTIAQATEMVKQNVNDNEAARKIGVSWAYYVNCKKSGYFFSDARLLNASRALLDADILVKTTSTEPKTILVILFSNMILEK